MRCGYVAASCLPWRCPAGSPPRSSNGRPFCRRPVLSARNNDGDPSPAVLPASPSCGRSVAESRALNARAAPSPTAQLLRVLPAAPRQKASGTAAAALRRHRDRPSQGAGPSSRRMDDVLGWFAVARRAWGACVMRRTTRTVLRSVPQDGRLAEGREPRVRERRLTQQPWNTSRTSSIA
jgi:hypothetical protein